jgi:uncharacterized membrane protein
MNRQYRNPSNADQQFSCARFARVGGVSGLFLAFFVAACGDGAADQRYEERFDDILPETTIELVGTEPFWRGRIEDGEFTYITPDNPEGAAFGVRRFTGNSGLGFTSAQGERTLDLVVTRGACSDGMSDRTFPYTATLAIDGELQRGCAWTAAEPFTGPAQP